MSRAELIIRSAGPHVSVQDGGRRGLMRFGVPASGPMDRLAFKSANVAIGNDPAATAIEVSLGGLTLECQSGSVDFAVAGGAFLVDHGEQTTGSWMAATLHAGQSLTLRRGQWGSWCYLALAGDVGATSWLGSTATHGPSGLGGGRLKAGQHLVIDNARAGEWIAHDFPCPIMARPRKLLHVTQGSQIRYFDASALSTLTKGLWTMTDKWDRMGVRLEGPSIAPHAPLDMPSEPVVRGSVQVAGDGVATVLLADHQTTGGYPKIATVLDADLDGMVQLRPREPLVFQVVEAGRAVSIARTHAHAVSRYLAGLKNRTGKVGT